MGKINYMINRIRKMNYGRFFSTINDVHNITHKNKFFIFLDMVETGLVHGAGYMDYQLFEMYKMNHKEKKTIVTRGRNNNLVKTFNKSEFYDCFRDKVLFNQKFDKYLNRDWLYVTKDNFKEFEKLFKKHDSLIIKPIDGTCGHNIEKISTKDTTAKDLYNYILENELYLVEEVAIQCKEIASLHPSSINTIRVVSLNGNVVLAFLRIGSNNNVVDNFNHDGIAAPIDINTGIINFPAIDKKHNVYDIHPNTKTKIVGFKIPDFDKVIKLIEEASKIIPEIGYVGWDVCLGEKKPFLIEGNEFPGHDIYQLPPHRKGNEGLYPLFQKEMKKHCK